MKIVYMGTPDFSVPTLVKLYNDKDVEIAYVVTKCDSKSKRGLALNFSAVKTKALELGIDILQPTKIKDDRSVIEKIKAAKPDFIIVVAYGEILSKEILDIPKIASINGHASLLPKYRGAAPIQTAILNGDAVTGTTTMLMDEGLDTGDILEQYDITIDKKETSDSLFLKLSHLTADAILHTIKNFDSIKSIKQDDTKSSKSKIIKKENGNIDFKNESAVDVERKIRAYTSWPSAYFEKDGVKYKIWDADVVDVAIDSSKKLDFTSDICIFEGAMYAKCSDGYIRINEIQKSGKNKMDIRSFINGLKS